MFKEGIDKYQATVIIFVLQMPLQRQSGYPDQLTPTYALCCKVHNQFKRVHTNFKKLYIFVLQLPL